MWFAMSITNARIVETNWHADSAANTYFHRGGISAKTILISLRSDLRLTFGQPSLKIFAPLNTGAAVVE